MGVVELKIFYKTFPLGKGDKAVVLIAESSCGRLKSKDALPTRLALIPMTVNMTKYYACDYVTLQRYFAGLIRLLVS